MFKIILLCIKREEKGLSRFFSKMFNCEKELMLMIIGGKWKMLIMWYLGKEGMK